MPTINYIFIRHGQGCHNLVHLLKQNNIHNIDKYYDFDPELSQEGVHQSLHNSNVITDLLLMNNIHTINVIASSGLLRSIETAYYMSQQWTNNPKIYVLPYLREISNKKNIDLDSVKEYKMNNQKIQSDKLKQKGILQYVDFTFNKNNCPGDLNKFRYMFRNLYKDYQSIINVFVVTHSGVLNKDCEKNNFKSTKGFVNNSGYILKETDNLQYTFIPLNGHVLKTTRYKFIQTDITKLHKSKRCNSLSCDI